MIKQIDLPEIKHLIPSEDQEAEMFQLLYILEQLYTVTMSLQSEKYYWYGMVFF